MVRIVRDGEYSRGKLCPLAPSTTSRPGSGKLPPTKRICITVALLSSSTPDSIHKCWVCDAHSEGDGCAWSHRLALGPRVTTVTAF